MLPTNLTQMFGKKLQIIGDLSCIQVNYVVDFTKIITLVVLGPPPPTKHKHISNRLHY